MDTLGDPLRHPNSAADPAASPTASCTGRAALLRSLHDRIQAVERRGNAAIQGAPSGHPHGGPHDAPNDSWLDLGFGETHEWFPDRPTERSEWVPPFSILIELVKRAACGDPPRWCVWIGPRVWPYGHALSRIATPIVTAQSKARPVGQTGKRAATCMLHRGMFVHATDLNDRDTAGNDHPLAD